MTKKTLTLIGLLALVVFAVVAAYVMAQRANIARDTMNTLDSGNPVQEEVDTTPETEDPERIGSVINSFIRAFRRSAPPVSDADSVETAVSLFSEGGKAAIPTDEAGNFMLQQLLGVQDVPQNHRISGFSYHRNAATGDASGLASVDVELIYSGNTVTRVFVLSKTAEGDWVIDSVSLPESEVETPPADETPESTETPTESNAESDVESDATAE